MGVKFPYLGDARALWFSIEKTEEERAVARKVGIMVRALVGHLIDVEKIDPSTARTNIEADYVKGILVFREEAPILSTNADTLIEIRGPRPLAIRLIQRDMESGDYGVLEAGRGRSEFKDFLWDDLMAEANKETKVRSKW